MKTKEKKLRSELFDDLMVSLNEVRSARVFSLIHELVAENLDAVQLIRRLKISPTQKVHAWDALQRALFKFIIRVAARKDTETLTELQRAVSEQKDFLGEPDLKQAIALTLRESLTPKLFGAEVPREIVFRLLRNSPPEIRKNCFEAVSDAFDELLKVLDERHYEHLVSSDMEKELSRREVQIKTELGNYYANLQAEELAKVLGELYKASYILGLARSDSKARTDPYQAIDDALTIVARLFKRLRVEPFGPEGSQVSFNSSLHESVGSAKAGEIVVVSRPGVAVFKPSGEIAYVVQKAVVRKQ